MKTIRKILFSGLLFTAFTGLFLNTAAAEVPRMSKEELRVMLDNDDVIVLDVRSGRDWSSSESKIEGAVREEAFKAEEWVSKYDKEKTYVLYCA